MVPGEIAIRERLAETYRPEGIEIWLGGMNAELDGRPIDLLRAGQYERVLAAVDRLEAGSHG